LEDKKEDWIILISEENAMELEKAVNFFQAEGSTSG